MRVIAAAFGAVLLILASAWAQESQEFGVTTPDMVRVQRALADRGFNPGPIDGQMGRRTEATIAAFQAAYGLQITGMPDEMTLKALFRPASEAAKDKPFGPGRDIVEVKAPEAIPLTPVESILLYQQELPAKGSMPAGEPPEPGPAVQPLAGIGGEGPGIEVLQSLAEQGHATAQFNLGFLYDYGQGVPKDQIEAMGWYRLAAEQGLAEAQFSIGVLYESGGGVEKDLEEAYRWYSLAAASVAPGKGRDIFAAYRDRVAREMATGETVEVQEAMAPEPAAPEPEAQMAAEPEPETELAADPEPEVQMAAEPAEPAEEEPVQTAAVSVPEPTTQAEPEPQAEDAAEAPSEIPVKPTPKPDVEITVGKGDNGRESSAMAAKAAVERGGLGDSALETLRLLDEERDTWSSADRARLIQQLLKDDGYYSGPIDGSLGAGTRAAMRKYQQANKLTHRTEAGMMRHFASRAHFLRGYGFHEAGNEANAIQEYSEAIRLEPRFANAYFNRGLIYYNQGDYMLAIVDFDTSLTHNPWNGPAFFNRANAYYELGFYFLAARDYLNAVTLEIKSW